MFHAPALTASALLMLCASAALAQPAQPQPAAGAAARAQAEVRAAGTAAEPRFDILEFEVEGNTVLDALAVERALLPHMGPGRTMADVEAARSALDRAYQGAGWLSVLVDVPEQRVEAGVVRLQVVEGRVERLRVTGARWYDQGRIRAGVPALVEGEVPNFNQAQAQLAELNRAPERQVQPVLRPGWQPGTVEVELKVQDQLPLSASVELHNRHAAHTEALRMAASLRYDNLFQREHALALSYSTAPGAPRQTQVLSLGYTVPQRDGAAWLWSFTASDSLTEPLGATVSGQGNTLGLRWARSFGDADGFHSLTLGGELRDLDQRVRAGTGAAEAGSEIATPLRYLPLSLGWSGQFQQRGERGVPSVTALNAQFSFGLRQLLRRAVDCPGTVGRQDQFHCNRDGADGGFATLRLDARHQHAAPLGLPGSLAWRLSGQLSGQPLVSGEQLVAGGAETVRGYLESEASGDLGLVGGLEWRSAELAPALQRGLTLPAGWLRSATLLGFVDAARLSVHDPLPGQAGRSTLAGAGLGLRLRAGAQGQADLDLAWPLKASAASPRGSLRVHARMALAF